MRLRETEDVTVGRVRHRAECQTGAVRLPLVRTPNRTMLIQLSVATAVHPGDPQDPRGRSPSGPNAARNQWDVKMTGARAM